MKELARYKWRFLVVLVAAVVPDLLTQEISDLLTQPPNGRCDYLPFAREGAQWSLHRAYGVELGIALFILPYSGVDGWWRCKTRWRGRSPVRCQGRIHRQPLFRGRRWALRTDTSSCTAVVCSREPSREIKAS